MGSILKEKSFQFAVKIVNLCRSSHEILFRQLLKSGTAIGALVREAEFAQSRADFVSKMSIALKEANEAIYWLEILESSDALKATPSTVHLRVDCKELIAMLVASVQTAKRSIGEKVKLKADSPHPLSPGAERSNNT
jgi:four helix bundle protein